MALGDLISQGSVSALELVGVFSVAYPEMEYIWGPAGLLSLAPRKSPSLATNVSSSRRSIGNSRRVNQQLHVCPSLFLRVLLSQAKFTLYASLSTHRVPLPSSHRRGNRLGSRRGSYLPNLTSPRAHRCLCGLILCS